MSRQDDLDLKKELASSPLTGHGFSNTLRKKIEHKMQEQSKPRKFRMPRFGWFGALGGVTMAVTFLVMFLSLQSGWMKHTERPMIGPSRPLAAGLYNEDEITKLHSTVLIGLRTDLPSGESEYRTVLIAPDDNRLKTAAEGKGILLPYGREFWKIDTLSSSSGDNVQRLVAHKANEPLKKLEAQEERVLLSGDNEKLLFVGNKYVSLMQQHRDANSDSSASGAEGVSFWVKELKQMTADMATVQAAPIGADYVAGDVLMSKIHNGETNQHVPLQTIFGTVADQISNVDNQWAVIREPGRWVPKVPDPPAKEQQLQANRAKSNNDSAARPLVLKDVTFPLPETVVSYDQLCCSWNEIEMVQPGARDAFSSPVLDMVAIVTSTEITFYRYNGHIVEKPLLTLKIRPNESIIMSQWAVDRYVQKWKDQVKKLLTP